MSVLPGSEAFVQGAGSADVQAHHSSASELSHLDQGFDSSDPNRSHHLLKHCLSDGQRGGALAHFSNADDVKEAAKEISKMGQRDLQSKFKLVYGTATHSNNNDWLRRKLYEAIGAAPVKIVAKPRPRKLASKQRKANMDTSHSMDDSTMHVIERRSRRVVRGTPKGQAFGAALRGPRALSSSLPSSPVVGRSVLDMHRFIAHEAATSTSDDSESWDDEKEVVGNNQGGEPRQVRQRGDSLEAGPRVLTVNRVITNTGPSPLFRPRASVPMFPRRPSSIGLLGFAAMNFDSSDDAWGSDAWADAALNATSTRGLSLGLADEDDILLLPMDLSAYAEDAVALV